jgi:hypothetical protein
VQGNIDGVIKVVEAGEKMELTWYQKMILSVLLVKIVRQKCFLFFQIVCRGNIPSIVLV